MKYTATISVSYAPISGDSLDDVMAMASDSTHTGTFLLTTKKVGMTIVGSENGVEVLRIHKEQE